MPAPLWCWLTASSTVRSLINQVATLCTAKKHSPRILSIMFLMNDMEDMLLKARYQEQLFQIMWQWLPMLSPYTDFVISVHERAECSPPNFLFCQSSLSKPSWSIFVLQKKESRNHERARALYVAVAVPFIGHISHFVIPKQTKWCNMFFQITLIQVDRLNLGNNKRKPRMAFFLKEILKVLLISNRLKLERFSWIY